MNVRNIVEIVRSRDQIVLRSEKHLRAINILQDIEELDKKLTGVQPYEQVLPKMKLRIGKNVIFLTEATGFLGSQILRQLLAFVSASKVIVLIRARNANSGFQRIMAADIIARWCLSALASRIEVWPEDFA